MLEIKCYNAASTDTFLVAIAAFLESAAGKPIVIKALIIFSSAKGPVGLGRGLIGSFSFLSTTAVFGLSFSLSLLLTVFFSFYFYFYFSFYFSLSTLGFVLLANLD